MITCIHTPYCMHGMHSMKHQHHFFLLNRHQRLTAQYTQAVPFAAACSSRFFWSLTFCLPVETTGFWIGADTSNSELAGWIACVKSSHYSRVCTTVAVAQRDGRTPSPSSTSKTGAAARGLTRKLGRRDTVLTTTGGLTKRY